MVEIPAGTFTMGSPESEAGRTPAEGPQHLVTIGYKLKVSKYPVTVSQFSSFVADTGYDAGDECLTMEGGTWATRSGRSWRTPGFPQNDRDPVVCVTWHDAKAFTAWLSKKTGHNYRLLSDAEYEYAGRGGTKTAFWWGDEVGVGHANCDGCGSPWGFKSASPVGSFPPNPFGLYDMSGNAWSWTEDCWNPTYAGAPTDGSVNLGGDCQIRIIRGASWISKPPSIRAGDRFRSPIDLKNYALGFRIAEAPE